MGVYLGRRRWEEVGVIILRVYSSTELLLVAM